VEEATCGDVRVKCSAPPCVPSDGCFGHEVALGLNLGDQTVVGQLCAEDPLVPEESFRRDLGSVGNIGEFQLVKKVEQGKLVKSHRVVSFV